MLRGEWNISEIELLKTLAIVSVVAGLSFISVTLFRKGGIFVSE